MGRSVVVLEPGRHLGGLTAGGLGATDIGNKAAIGGLSREFYRRVGRHYRDPAAWSRERPDDYQSRRKTPGEAEMWTFEPHVAEQVYRDWLAEKGIEVLVGERLDLEGGVAMDGPAISSIRTESGRTVAGRMFIDATYEGDLMAEAGVSFHVGREANAAYGETFNGIQAAHAVEHQFTHDVDPYVVPGDPASGLLPRNFEAGDRRIPWHPVLMPNRKTDTNNNFAISTDFLGANHDYPCADHATRERIIAAHRDYQQGLMWTLANHPRVPAEVRAHVRRWGPARDEFIDNDNWPHQLHVREARRMVSDVVMTQHHCQRREVVDDPVGLGAYSMDSHNVRLPLGLAHRLRIDPHGTSVHGARPVGGDGGGAGD